MSAAKRRGSPPAWGAASPCSRAARQARSAGGGAARRGSRGPADGTRRRRGAPDAAIATADLVIGAVLEPGTLSPKLISRAAVRAMRPGSALVDVGIDQGGIAETSRMTTLSSPTYVDEGVVHYAVPNMPALVARTATLALAAATLPYVQALADAGIAPALDADAGTRARRDDLGGRGRARGLAADAGIDATRLRRWRARAPAASPRRALPCAFSASPAGPAAARRR